MRKWLTAAVIGVLVCGLCSVALAKVTPTYIPCECGLGPDPAYTADGYVILYGGWDGGISPTYHVIIDWMDGTAEDLYTTEHDMVFTHQYDTTGKPWGHQWQPLLTVINKTRAEAGAIVILQDWIVPRGIKFEGSSEYTLTHRGTPIADPVWTTDQWGNETRNEPVCYLKGTPLTVRLDLFSHIAIPPQGLLVKVRCQGHNQETGLPLFTGEYRNILVTDWNSEDYDSYLSWTSSNLPAYVTKYPLHLVFDFWVYQGGGNWVYWNQYERGHHTVYTTLSQPMYPMGQPWTEVIDRAATWCDRLSDENAVSNEMARDLYNATWTWRWNVESHTYLNGSWGNQTFKLAEMLDSDWGDSRDFANLHACLLRSLGCPCQPGILLGPYMTNPVLGAGATTWAEKYLLYHQFVWHSMGPLVHDASVKVDQANPKYVFDMTLEEYCNYLGWPIPPVWVPVDFCIQ